MCDSSAGLTMERCTLIWLLIFFTTFLWTEARISRLPQLNLTEEQALIDGLTSLQQLKEEDFLEILDENRGWGIGRCFDDLNYTVHHYATTQWGMQMFDSNAKVPWGVLQGSFVFMGQFDECVYVQVPDPSDNTTTLFEGQHCMADVNISLPLGPNQKMNMPFFYGLCIPSTCTAGDLQMLLTAVVEAKTNLTVHVKVDPNNCRGKNIPDPSAGDWVVVGVFFGFIAMGIASTIYDVRQRFSLNNDKPHQLWSAFSFYTNGKYLLSTTKDPNMMTALFGIRTITMGWVVLGHAYLNTVYSPVINLVNIVDMNHDHTKVLIFNSFVSVDTFFLLSGMLACFVFFRTMSRSRSFDQPMGYLHRFLRLTPPYAAVVLFEATVFNFMGNGPFWHRIHEQSSQNCKDYWWSSILYVQNFVNPLKLCLTQSWYLSADMQMYWLSPLVLYPMYLWPAIAVPYLGFLILAVSFLDFSFVYIYDLPANFALNPSDDRMTMDYYPFYTRMAPWLIGVALGYLIGGIKAKKIRFNLSPTMQTVGWILSTVLMTASMQAMDYFNSYPDYTALECAFFLAFHRVGWAIGLGWIILACANDIGGVVNKILSFPLFQPLAKLSFCSYLLHISVQRFRIGWLRTNVALEDVDVVWKFIADFVVSNLVSIIFFLLFEQPFTHIDRFLLQGRKIFPWPAPRPPRAKVAEVQVEKAEEVKELEEKILEKADEKVPEGKEAVDDEQPLKNQAGGDFETLQEEAEDEVELPEPEEVIEITESETGSKRQSHA